MMARTLGNELGADGSEDTRVGETDCPLGQDIPAYLAPPSNASGFDVEEFIRRSWHNIWNRRSLREVTRAYHPSLVCRASSGRVLYGTR